MTKNSKARRTTQNFRFLAALCLLVFFTRALADAPFQYTPNYHLVGWLNTVAPGSGEGLLGNEVEGLTQLSAEAGTFLWGYSISRRTPMTLDGVPEQVPEYNRVLSKQQQNINADIFADALQEFGIKYHFVNTFDAYREAAKRQGVTLGIDQTPTNDLFLAPFKSNILSDPWVWFPLMVVAGYAIEDYITTVNGTLNRQANLTATSNYMYAVNYLGVQSIGSGAPEEMFFRGFMQHEFEEAVPSPWFSIPATTALFAFAHAPGNGRYTAAAAGTYLGYLAHRENGQLSKGIAVHFWGVVILGIETVMLTQKAERALPPTAFQVQVNY
jgi:hypothetical protein